MVITKKLSICGDFRWVGNLIRVWLYNSTNQTSEIDEFLKKSYFLDELIPKLPQISLYYYHYLSFFCRPFFKNFFYNNTIQNYFDNKAEIFYKETYEVKNNKNLKKKKKMRKEWLYLTKKQENY